MSSFPLMRKLTIYTWSVKGKEKKLNFLCKELA